MFVQKEKNSSRAAARAADVVDLVIEFATLGEYGLEYPDQAEVEKRRGTLTDLRLDRGRTGASPQRHRQVTSPCRPGRSRVDLPGWNDRPGHEVPGVQPGRRHRAETMHLTPSRKSKRNRPTSALPAALRPPRIRLETV